MDADAFVEPAAASDDIPDGADEFGVLVFFGDLHGAGDVVGAEEDAVDSVGGDEGLESVDGCDAFDAQDEVVVLVETLPELL